MLNSELVLNLKHVNIITPAGQINKQAARMLSKHPLLYDAVHTNTLWLGDDATIRTRIYVVMHNITSQPVCKTCGMATAFNPQKNRFNNFCPNTAAGSCAKNNTQLEQQRKQTMFDRYGVDVPLKNPDIKLKAQQTMFDRYGVTAAAHIPAVMEQRVATNLARYGHRTYAESTVNVTATQVLADEDWLIERLKDFTITEIADELQTSTHTIRKYISMYNISVGDYTIQTSAPHRDICKLLDAHNIQYVTNDKKIISPKEVDIYIPDHNIAIEYDGIFYHSEISGRNKRYHSDKTVSCNNIGVQLLHVWSNEWLTKNDIVKSRISNAIGASSTLYARKCKVIQLDTNQQRAFFDSTHIQGYAPSTVCYGLMFDNEIVAAMSFIRSRFTNKYEWELLRFSAKLYHHVTGGASKLFKHFMMLHNPKTVVSYCDYRWGQGGLYTKLGFVHSHDSSPNYFYFKRNADTNKLWSRVVFQKHKLEKALDVFDPTLTEWDNMVNNGYDRIWDCGNGVFVWTPL